jgi:GntR family uxuAB operon transcriptional repressor
MLSNKRRYFEIGTQIEELLDSGVFKAGQRLPSERVLSEKFETSRATIREAIIMLELKGLVEVKQGAGIYFIESKQVQTGPPNQYNDIGPFELLQARQVVESNIACFAATQIKFNELKALKRVLIAQENEINRDSKKFEELDHQFHQLIAESTQNRVLIDQATEMWKSVRTHNPLWKALNHKYLHEADLQSQWICDHKRILLALQRRAAEDVKQAVWQHIENSKVELMKIATSDGINADIDDFFFAGDM